jgi:hypothetical protein
MTEENPGTDPITNSPGSSPRIEQSILKRASVGGDLTTGDISLTVNNQSSGAGDVNIGGNVSGSWIVTGSGNNIYNSPPPERSVKNRHNLPAAV